MIADVHLAPTGTPPTWWHGRIDGAQMHGHLRQALAWLESQVVSAIIVVGDLTELANAESADVVLRECTALGVPVFAVPGNHDVGPNGSVFARVRNDGHRVLEVPGPRGTLMADGLRVAGQPLAIVDGEVSAADSPDTDYWGEDPTLWVSHYPALSRRKLADEAGVLYAGDLANVAVVAATLRDRGAPTIALHGHLHFRAAAVDGHVLQIGMPALAESPHELVVLDLEIGSELVLRLHTHALQPRFQRSAPAFAPAQECWSYRAGSWRPGSSE